MSHFFKGFVDELVKLGFHESWGVGGLWQSHGGEPTTEGSPLLHEQGIPFDVDWKNHRQDYFMGRVQPQEEGKIVPGRLGPSKLRDKNPPDHEKADGKRR